MILMRKVDATATRAALQEIRQLALAENGDAGKQLATLAASISDRLPADGALIPRIFEGRVQVARELITPRGQLFPTALQARDGRAALRPVEARLSHPVLGFVADNGPALAIYGASAVAVAGLGTGAWIGLQERRKHAAEAREVATATGLPQEQAERVMDAVRKEIYFHRDAEGDSRHGVPRDAIKTYDRASSMLGRTGANFTKSEVARILVNDLERADRAGLVDVAESDGGEIRAAGITDADAVTVMLADMAWHYAPEDRAERLHRYSVIKKAAPADVREDQLTIADAVGLEGYPSIASRLHRLTGRARRDVVDEALGSGR